MNAQRALHECAEIQKLKQQDYTSGTNRMENFERSSIIASWFKHDADKSFAVLIGTKLARLASLLNKSNDRNSTPKFESIEDTFKDTINYFALWGENSCPDYTSGSTDYDDHNTHIQTINEYLKSRPVEVVSNRPMRLPLQIKKPEEFIRTPKYKREQELIYMLGQLDEDEMKDLISRARIYISRKKII